MTRSETLGVLCAGGGMLVLGSSFAVSSLLVDYPFFASQALRYALATVALAVIARRGLFSESLSLPDLAWLCAVALTGLVGAGVALGIGHPASSGQPAGA